MSSSSARCTRARRLRDVGDLKAGGDGACTDSLYTTALANFNTLKRPLVWLPGDNDWTDCWGCYGPGTGGFDPWNARPASELFAEVTRRRLAGSSSGHRHHEGDAR